MDIQSGRQGAIPVGILLGKQTALSRSRTTPTAADHSHHTHEHSADSPHVGVDSWSVILDQPLPWARFRDWLDLVYSLHAGRMLRMKGILWVEEQGLPLLIQAVGPVVTPLSSLENWTGAPQSRLVLIAQGISRQAFDRSFSEHVLKC
jgi:G3E family GTPase